MNKHGKVKEISLTGAIFLVIVGIAFLGSANSDPSGIVGAMGVAILGIGFLVLAVVIIKLFSE